ncbi:MAG: Methyltransferase type 11 [Gemmatimonadetes bacterium]|nr:Methyltransferase type 11 [Gemmatimonadota bacterium]
MRRMTEPLRPSELREQFGDIDIYLFDQLLRGRIGEGMRVLDAGCGGGRNLVFMLRAGMDVHGIDESADAIAAVRRQAAVIAPKLPAERFSVQPVDAMSFASGSMDVVLSSAVLHFARDEAHFTGMLGEMWRVLAPGGLLFCRLASSIGIEGQVRPLGNRRHLLPDGSERFLVDASYLLEHTRQLGGTLLDPLKTTIVHGMRSMTTWVVRKAGG